MENINLKTIVIVVLLCVTNYFVSNAQWSDNFDDGEYLQNPVWVDDSLAYYVNTPGQLQLNAPEKEGKSYIYTSSLPATNALWEFNVKMGFNPSSGNYCRIYLMADKPNPKDVSKGYFLKIGSTNDDICLFKKDENSETLLIDGRDKILNTSAVNLTIKILRDYDGKWQLFCDSTGNTNYSFLGEKTDNSVLRSRYFIVECVYSATRSNKFFFDDFNITGNTYSDGTKPELIKCQPLPGNKIECIFSETLTNATSSSFMLNESIVPSNIQLNQGNIILNFSGEFLCESDNSLHISNVNDEWNNAINDTTVYFRYCTPDLFDVVFNEIMADPSPPVELQESEYLEIFNRSNKTFNTGNWQIKIGDNSFVLPDTLWYPGTYFIICRETYQTEFEKYGISLGIFTSSNALTNSGQQLELFDSYGKLIALLEYDDAWYNDDYKASGGWSLEQIDPANPCSGKNNWTASKSFTGGTPGNKNSVFAANPDLTAPELKWIYIPNDTNVILTFNEPLLSSVQLQNTNFAITPSTNAPIQAILQENNYNVIELKLGEKLESNKRYNLSVDTNIGDCTGNTINPAIDTLISLPGTTDSTDIIINEVLFNPPANCPEYIELYNQSDKMLDGSDLLISITSGENTTTFKASNDAFLFYPRSYLLICPEPETLYRYFNILSYRAVHSNDEWTSMDDKSGQIKLLTKDMHSIDVFDYAETLHDPSLTGKEGISLERVNPDIPACYPGNWHSAAETAGYGTPGSLNSQFIKEIEIKETITLPDEIFSPDNDGYKDQLQICYHFEITGYRISIWIFDAIGRKVRQISNNLYPENTSQIFWDGISDEGKLCPPGIYLVFVRAVNENGDVKEFKKACVLAIKR